MNESHRWHEHRDGNRDGTLRSIWTQNKLSHFAKTSKMGMSYWRDTQRAEKVTDAASAVTRGFVSKLNPNHFLADIEKLPANPYVTLPTSDYGFGYEADNFRRFVETVQQAQADESTTIVLEDSRHCPPPLPGSDAQAKAIESDVIKIAVLESLCHDRDPSVAAEARRRLQDLWRRMFEHQMYSHVDETADSAHSLDLLAATIHAVLPNRASDEHGETFKSWLVAIAQNPAVPANILSVLLPHHDEDIRIALIYNPASPGHIYESLVKDKRFQIRWHLAGCELTPSPVLEALRRLTRDRAILARIKRTLNSRQPEPQTQPQTEERNEPPVLVGMVSWDADSAA